MATETIRGAMRLVDDTISSQAGLLDRWSDQLQEWIRNAVSDGGPAARSLKNFLNGVWLGHPMHPALTDVPIGAWMITLIMDLFGQEEVADASLAVGVLTAVPTAAAGAADWSDTGSDSRRVGLVHALLNSTALVLYIWSWLARRNGSRPLGVGLSTAGTTIATLSAWLGGELVYRQGTGVSRNAWDPFVIGWQVAAKSADLQEGKLGAGEVTVEGQKLPLVLLKRGAEVLALSGVCSHWGGPLAEGKLVEGDCVECPWHGSRFSMLDGSVHQGPASVPAHVFEARIREGNIEVRRGP